MSNQSDSDQALRTQLLALLNGRNAHLNLDDAVAGFPLEQINSYPPSVPYTPWHLLVHIRISQRDILEFILDPDYVSPEWPAGYWPDPQSKADAEAWVETIAAIHADLQSLREMVSSPNTDLTSDIPHAPGYNILREVLLVADHTAYHVGEFAILRQVMGTWPADRGVM